ncbi:hypothetical protein BGZ94_008287 [Podila epigama]|nr:hypothetical protein BGZ94_008287 [Podila epigama]
MSSSTNGKHCSPGRGQLSGKVNRLDHDPVPRRDPTGSAGRLYDPKRDPVPVVPATVAQSISRAGESRSPNNISGSSPKQQQQQRLYDPNQPQSAPRQPSGPAAVAANTAAMTSSPRGGGTSSSKSPNVQVTAPPSAPVDGLVKLTKEIQALEKKVMEKPSRRSLESDDDDSEYSRRGGNMTWSRRIDDSKRLAMKYLKLIQLDFKSSLRHDIDARCWKLAIYPLIEAFRTALRDSEQGSDYSYSDDDDDDRETVRYYFTQFITVAQEFYATLMSTLQMLDAKFATLGASGSSPRAATHPPRWHRCVGTLGDLARYRWLHKLNDDHSPPTDWLVAARRLYREAIDLGPGNGKMYNQLALLAGCRSLESLYYYCKSLTVKSSFVSARETLRSFFGTNDQIRALDALSLKQNAKARHAALAHTTIRDCEASFLLLQAMLFEKVNLDLFEKRFRFFDKQLRILHLRKIKQDTSQNLTAERWEEFYFMMAIINLAAVYEFNWSSSIIAKSAAVFGDLPDHLMTVTTLPYSARLLLGTMEQCMLRCLSASGDEQKVNAFTTEEQHGWLIYCHLVLTWMASQPFGSHGDMMPNWLVLADEETLPTFWSTLTTFMNHHWNALTPFEQSDMLSAFSEDLTSNATQDTEQVTTSQDVLFQLSTPPLDHEWELRGLAWMPTTRYGSNMFKSPFPILDEVELKSDCLWKHEPFKLERVSKRLVELGLVASLNMGVVAFEFCDNAFKLNEEYAAQVQEAALAKSVVPSMTNEGYSSDDGLLSSSHANFSQDESGLEEENVVNGEGSEMSSLGDSASGIMELKTKRDQLKMMLSEANVQSPRRDGQRHQSTGNTSGRNNAKGGRSAAEHRRAHHQDQGNSSRRVKVADNSVLVIDTNCLVADWTVVQKLVAADRWTVIIPLAVVTELDGLKNNPAPLGPAAAAALTYLEGCLAQRPRMRRLKVQTSRGNYMNDLSFRVESFNYDQQPSSSGLSLSPSHRYNASHRRSSSMGDGGNGGMSSEWEDDGDEEIMRNHNVDDFILGLCLWHQNHPAPSMSSSSTSPSMGSPSLGSTLTICLVTDDRNLRVKARARNVDVLGKDDILWMATNSTPATSVPSQLPQHQPLRIVH